MTQVDNELEGNGNVAVWEVDRIVGGLVFGQGVPHGLIGVWQGVPLGQLRSERGLVSRSKVGGVWAAGRADWALWAPKRPHSTHSSLGIFELCREASQSGQE